jgi:hypothetical protein
MFVKPAPHPDHPQDGTKFRSVRIPHTYALLPEAGREVPENAFWIRRLAQGDVVRADPPAPPAPAIADAPAEGPAAAPAVTHA